jgi:outer membrane immunogenic protein
VIPPFSRTGFYVGVNGGYGWNSARGNGSNFFANPSGGLIGGAVGANYQIGQFLVGIEDNLDWADMTNSRTLLNGVSTGSRIDAFASAQLRNKVADPLLNGMLSQ